MDMEIVQRFSQVFPSGAPAYYTADFSKVAAVAAGVKCKPVYTAIDKKLSLDNFRAHLAGERGLVLVPVDASGLCSFGVIDIDDYQLDLLGLGRKIDKLRLPLILCRSKSGGAHLYYLCRARQASPIRELLAKWARLLGYPRAEIFPKQDRLTDGDTGSAINLPYLGGARNVQVAPSGDVPLDKFIDMATGLRDEGAQDEEVERVAQLISPLWLPNTKRHDVALALSGALLRGGVEQERVGALIERIVTLTMDEDATDRRKMVWEAASAVKGDKHAYGVPILRQRIEELGGEARIVDDILVAFDVKKKTATTDVPEMQIPPRTPLDWPAMQTQEPPQREWLMSFWLPAGHVALLSGKAGIGKTLIAQHIGTSVVLGREYVAHVPRPRRVLMWAGEDDVGELWRRQLAINTLFDTSLADLSEKFFLQSYSGVDMTLAATSYGSLVPTPMMNELRDQVHDYNVDLVIIDNSARVFGGNENERHAVTTFIAWLEGACGSAAVLLLAHPAKATASEYSGSTAWEGAVRTRMYMSDQRPGGSPQSGRGDDDVPIDPRVRYLSRRKANYSPLDCREFELTEGGVLVPEAIEGGGDRPAPTQEESAETVMRAVERLRKIQIHMTTSPSVASYLPRLASGYRLLGRLSQSQFAGTMRAMLLSGQLVITEDGRNANRTPRMGIKLP